MLSKTWEVISRKTSFSIQIKTFWLAWKNIHWPLERRKNKMKLRFGVTKIKKANVLFFEEKPDIKKAIPLSRQLASSNWANSGRVVKLILNYWRIVVMLHNVLCSLCVVIHQRFSDLESHQISSQVAADPVLQNPELYTVSLISVINNDIHHFV